MPIRAFVSQNLTQLQATLALLEKASQSGSLEELRVSGIMTRTGAMTQRDLDTRYAQCRYELYLRALAMDDTDPNKAALVLQYTNPYSETVRRVEARYRQCWPFTITTQ